MRFCNAAMVVICGLFVSVHVQASDVEDILRRSAAIKANPEAMVGAVPKPAANVTFEEEARKLAERAQAIRDAARRSGPSAPAKTEQAMAWQALEEAAEQHGGAQNAASAQGVPEEPEVYVFISLSMPSGGIQSLFAEAVAEVRPVQFVLRGWKPPHFAETVRQLSKLFPLDDSGAPLAPEIIVDPSLWQKAEITAAPTIVTRGNDGSWHTVKGAGSLALARRVASERRELTGPAVGPVYEPDEPDLLKEIETRIAAYDWDKDIQRIRSNVLNRQGSGELPRALGDETYLVDPSITLQEDVAGPNGRLLAAGGSKLNPLEYMTLSKAYIAFDPLSSGQRQQVRSWLSEHDTAFLLVTRLPQSGDGLVRLEQEFGRPVHELNSLLISRLQLRAVPSLVTQQGNRLKIEVKGVD